MVYTITSSRAASSQLSLPNIAKDQIVGYVRVPASTFRGGAPFKGPTLVKARFGQIGFGTEIELFRRPIVYTKGIQIYSLEYGDI